MWPLNIKVPRLTGCVLELGECSLLDWFPRPDFWVLDSACVETVSGFLGPWSLWWSQKCPPKPHSPLWISKKKSMSYLISRTPFLTSNTQRGGGSWCPTRFMVGWDVLKVSSKRSVSVQWKGLNFVYFFSIYRYLGESGIFQCIKKQINRITCK